MNITAVAGLVVCAFVLAKSFFLTVGWFTRDHEDLAIRRHLDTLVEALDHKAPVELIRDFFRRLVVRVNESLANHQLYTAAFVIFSLILNLISLLALLEAYGRIEKGMSGYALLTDVVEQYSLPVVFSIGILLPLLAALFDLLSLWVTWKLINQAAQDTTISRIAGHIGLDILVAVAATLWSLLLFIIVENTLVSITDQEVSLALSFANYLDLVGRRLLERPGYLAGIIILGLTSALPTVTYLSLAGFFLIILISPTCLQKAGSRVAYLVTTDGRPFFSQIGSLAAFVLSAVTLLFGVLIPETQPNAAPQLPFPEQPKFTKLIDQALRDDDVNWGFRSYSVDSVRVTRMTEFADGVEIEGTFRYSEFGSTYKKNFRATILRRQNNSFLLGELCWRTLGGIDCVDRR